MILLLSTLALHIAISADGPPPSEATELLVRYLTIRTDHPDHGTEEAANFWMNEAEKEEIHGATWSIDPTRKCVHFIGYLPATTVSDLSPILLLHHGDTVPAIESEWKTPPFSPIWVRTETDWDLHGRGVIDDKGHGVTHWMAIKRLKEKSRARDIYFVMNCGEEVSDPLGAAAFVHLFIKTLPEMPQVQFELSTTEKIETARVAQRFPSLSKIGWLWNEGSFGSTTEIKPYTLVPVATSQKGQWVGKVNIDGPGGHAALASKPTALEMTVDGLHDLYDQNHSWRHRLTSLHYEMKEMVHQVASVRPFYERWLLNLYPRLMFEMFGLQSMVASWWVAAAPAASIDPRIRSLPNVVSAHVSTPLEYRFLGAKSSLEIEATLKKVFSPYVKEPYQLQVTTTDFSPFRRDFLEGVEADQFRRVIESYPKTLMSPFITPGITDSRYYRMAGVRAFDLVPFFLDRDQIGGMHGKDERLPSLELARGIDIEEKILTALVR